MPRSALASLSLVALLGALALAPQLRAQAPARVEHRVLSWTLADTEAVLREVTGQGLTSVEQMAHEVARADREPVADVRVQAAVDARLQRKLDEAGADGWEMVEVLDTPANIGGVLLPAPRVYLRRRP